MANAYDPGAAYSVSANRAASGNDLVSFYVDDFQLTYVPPPTIQTRHSFDLPNLSRLLPRRRSGRSDRPVRPACAVADQALRQHDTGQRHEVELGGDRPRAPSTMPMAMRWSGMAVCNNMRVRGHNLVWATGAQTPAYATGDGTNSPANQAVVTANIQEHIQNEVQHFGTKIVCVGRGERAARSIAAGLPGAWAVLQGAGAELSRCGIQGGEAVCACRARSCSSMTTAPTDPTRLACLVKVVGELQARGIPIDGVGHEMHNSINYPSRGVDGKGHRHGA